jgi:hypothetical protein
MTAIGANEIGAEAVPEHHPGQQQPNDQRQTIAKSSYIRSTLAILIPANCEIVVLSYRRRSLRIRSAA